MRTLQVWPFNPTRTWVGEPGPCRSIEIAGGIATARIDGLIRVWSFESGKLISQFNVKGARSALSPDGGKLVCGSTVYWTADGQILRELGRGVVGDAFSPDGTRLVVAPDFGGRGEFTRLDDPEVLDLETGATTRLPANRCAVGPIAWNRTGDALAGGTLDRSDGWVWAWRWNGEKFFEIGKQSSRFKQAAARLAWVDDRHLLVLLVPPPIDSDEPIRVLRYDVVDGAETVLEIAPPRAWPTARSLFTRSPRRVVYALSSRYVAVGNVESGDVTVFSATNGSVLAVRCVRDVDSLHFLPDDQSLAVGTSKHVDVFRIAWR